jgi:hypothetical protein
MAKAATSVSDWIWLSDALRHAQAAAGSRARAEFTLKQLLASGALSWTAVTWIPRHKYVRTTRGGQMRAVPADGVSNGDPLFFRLADIDWDNSSAREASTPLGAKAQGIQVSWARLLELQPGANLAAWARKPGRAKEVAARPMAGLGTQGTSARAW